MKNSEWIAKEAVACNLYTQAEADSIMKEKGELPIHTFAKWKQLGFCVKKGEKATIKTSLWKNINYKYKDEGNETLSGTKIISAVAYLFTENQVEKIRR